VGGPRAFRLAPTRPKPWWRGGRGPRGPRGHSGCPPTRPNLPMGLRSTTPNAHFLCATVLSGSMGGRSTTIPTTRHARVTSALIWARCEGEAIHTCVPNTCTLGDPGVRHEDIPVGPRRCNRWGRGGGLPRGPEGTPDQPRPPPMKNRGQVGGPRGPARGHSGWPPPDPNRGGVEGGGPVGP
jgi:hypothetical protein